MTRRVCLLLLGLFVLGEVCALLWWLLPDDLRVVPVLLGCILGTPLVASLIPRAQHEPVAGGSLPPPATEADDDDEILVVGGFFCEACSTRFSSSSTFSTSMAISCACGTRYRVLPYLPPGPDDAASRRTVLHPEDDE